MSRTTLEERVAVLERQVGALLANHAGTGRAKDWRRTRGAFTGDGLMSRSSRKVARFATLKGSVPNPAAVRNAQPIHDPARHGMCQVKRRAAPARPAQ
jgi:hypothetical protein